MRPEALALVVLTTILGLAVAAVVWLTDKMAAIATAP